MKRVKTLVPIIESISGLTPYLFNTIHDLQSSIENNQVIYGRNGLLCYSNQDMVVDFDIKDIWKRLCQIKEDEKEGILNPENERLRLLDSIGGVLETEVQFKKLEMLVNEQIASVKPILTYNHKTKLYEYIGSHKHNKFDIVSQ